MAKIISLDLGDVLTTDPVFRPSMISREHMPEIFSNIPESVKVYARQVITIPIWAIVRGRTDPGFKTWYKISKDSN